MAAKAQIESVAVAAKDGSAAFPRFRHQQLGLLYNTLSDNRDELAQARQADGATRADAELELTVVLQHVSTCFKSAEYKVLSSELSAGQKSDVLHKPVGLVAILGDARAPMSSLFIPFAYAVRAGNAVALVLPEATSNVNGVITKIMTALDRFSFAFVDASATSEVLKASPALIVNARQLSSEDRSTAISKGSQLLPPSSSAPFATFIVDREQRSPQTLQLIARYLVRGKFLAYGRLPGSVQHLLVHEDRAAELKSLLLHEIKLAFGDKVEGGEWSPSSKDSDEWSEVVRNETKRGSGTVFLGGATTSKGASFPPTLLENVSSTFFKQRVAGPILPIETFVSLEGALAQLEKTKSDVVYAFMTPENLAYLAAESACSEVYANDVPVDALYTPLSLITDLSHYRRTTRVSSTSLTQASQNRLSYLFAPFTSAKLDFLRAELPLGKQVTATRTKHSNSLLRVFFLQGVFLTLGTVLTILLSTAGFGGWTTFKWLKGRYFV